MDPAIPYSEGVIVVDLTGKNTTKRTRRTFTSDQERQEANKDRRKRYDNARISLGYHHDEWERQRVLCGMENTHFIPHLLALHEAKCGTLSHVRVTGQLDTMCNRSTQTRKMVRCVVACCPKTSQERVSLHKWPKDPKRSSLWKRFVKMTRAKWAGPSDTSFVCSAHFTEDQFMNWSRFKLGFDNRLRLQKEAVPTIYPDSEAYKTHFLQSCSKDTPSRTAILQQAEEKEGTNMQPPVFTASPDSHFQRVQLPSVSSNTDGTDCSVVQSEERDINEQNLRTVEPLMIAPFDRSGLVQHPHYMQGPSGNMIAQGKVWRHNPEMHSRLNETLRCGQLKDHAEKMPLVSNIGTRPAVGGGQPHPPFMQANAIIENQPQVGVKEEMTESHKASSKNKSDTAANTHVESSGQEPSFKLTFGTSRTETVSDNVQGPPGHSQCRAPAFELSSMTETAGNLCKIYALQKIADTQSTSSDNINSQRHGPVSSSSDKNERGHSCLPVKTINANDLTKSATFNAEDQTSDNTFGTLTNNQTIFDENKVDAGQSRTLSDIKEEVPELSNTNVALDRDELPPKKTPNAVTADLSAPLSMIVEDEDPQIDQNIQSKVYLTDITSKKKIMTLKRKETLLTDFDDIEQALFPEEKKKRRKTPTKKPKQSAAPSASSSSANDIFNQSLIFFDESGKVVSIPEEVEIKKEKVEEQENELVYDDFYYEAAYESPSEEESPVDKDPDWDPDQEYRMSDNENKKSSTRKRKSKQTETYSESDESEVSSEGEHSIGSDEEDVAAAEVTYNCDKCDTSFKNIWQCLVAHISKEHPVETTTIKCDICDGVFTEHSDLNYHMKEVHSMSPFPVKILDHYFCPDCSEKHPSTLSYIFHREGRHETCLLICKMCGEEVRNRYLMKTHMKYAHEETDFVEYSKQVQLKKLGVKKMTTKQKNLSACFMCGEMFKRSYELDRHRKEKHADLLKQNFFKCSLCDKMSDHVHKLTTHYKFVHSQQMSCDFCNVNVSVPGYSKHLEQAHLRIISGYCKECQLLFRSTTALKKHVQSVHKDKRTHLCDTCGRGFKNNYSLSKHNLIHSGEKPMACEFCEYRCRQRTALDWHMKKNHPDQIPSHKDKKSRGRPQGRAKTKKMSNVKVPKASRKK